MRPGRKKDEVEEERGEVGEGKKRKVMKAREETY